MVDRSSLQGYKNQLLLGTYTLIIGGSFLLIWRQPGSWSIKAGQFESMFKGTTLGAVVAGIAINGKMNRARSSPG